MSSSRAAYQLNETQPPNKIFKKDWALGSVCSSAKVTTAMTIIFFVLSNTTVLHIIRFKYVLKLVIIIKKHKWPREFRPQKQAFR